MEFRYLHRGLANCLLICGLVCVLAGPLSAQTPLSYDSPGAVTVEPLGDDRYRVQAHNNGSTLEMKLTVMMWLRTAELALEKGHTHYRFLSLVLEPDSADGRTTESIAVLGSPDMSQVSPDEKWVNAEEFARKNRELLQKFEKLERGTN